MLDLSQGTRTLIGRSLFWLLWPLVWLYAPLSRRVRVVVIRDNKVLVVKNWFGSGRWQLPGGGIKFGESPIDAGVREVEEELSVALSEPQLLHDDVRVVSQNGLLMRYHFIEGNLEDVSYETSIELVEYSWMSCDDLKEVDKEVTIGVRLVK